MATDPTGVKDRGPRSLKKQEMNLEFPENMMLAFFGVPGSLGPSPVTVHGHCNPKKIDRLDLGSSRVLHP